MTNSNPASPEAYEYLDGVALGERERLSAVRRYQLVDQPAEEAYVRVAFVAGAVFDTPVATVSLVEQDRVWLAGCVGLSGVREVGKEPGLCASVIQQDDVYVINNAAVDPRTLAHPLVRGELGLRFYAAAPIRTHDGHRLGTVNVIDNRPREASPRQLAALEHLAAMVADELELRLMVVRSAAAERRMRENVH
ncbi:GAF domain-containing protein [Krasilnikovia cinnamomea]|uniref:GAF domain-containing protein n=1 Tax=Krasilnikovia cinnamomea TaxID=349313 RepID=A0A4Q7ZFN3_9ACTN|nr:GAF domain-containing protein [Krasilnikovia cinnamomea]RZU49557.1 GAF domain-containing protein [Krasilnikovia cinnamomea]